MKSSGYCFYLTLNDKKDQFYLSQERSMTNMETLLEQELLFDPVPYNDQKGKRLSYYSIY